jgi:hypothetical protein
VAAGIAQSVWRLVMGWTVRRANSCVGEISPTRPDRPRRLPSLLYNEYRVSFLRVNRTGRGVNHPPLSSAEVEERVHVYRHLVLQWHFIGRTLPYLYLILQKCSDNFSDVSFYRNLKKTDNSCFYVSRSFITLFMKPDAGPYPEPVKSRHIVYTSFRNVYFNIIRAFTPRSSK